MAAQMNEASGPTDWTLSHERSAAQTEAELTEAVLAQFEGTSDPRLREILKALTHHLHAFVRETAISLDEWRGGIDFLTRVGHMCRDNRQEFIMLSDVLGLSMMVDAVDHRVQTRATESTVLGPFFVDQSPSCANDTDIGEGLGDDLLHVTARIMGDYGRPLTNADVDIWQCDEHGRYDMQYEGRDAFCLRGRFRTDDVGQIRFWTIVPTAYPIPHDGPVGDLLEISRRHPWRPAHIHFRIAAGQHRTLVTHLFMAGGPYLESDVVFGVKPSLVVEVAPHAPGTAPDGRVCPGGWKSLDHSFTLARA